MAIYKEIPTGYGIVLEYHKITDIKIDTYTSTASFNVHSWTSEQNRASCDPICTARFEAITIDYDNAILSDLYQYLKSTDMYMDAIDII